MDNLENVFTELLDSIPFEESQLDYSILEKHALQIVQLSGLANSYISSIWFC